MKHDRRHKARLVADGHLANVPLLSVCSGVLSLRGIRLVTFAGEMSRLESWGADTDNVCLEALTKERHVQSQAQSLNLLKIIY